jgi:aminoglycoside phosphotransferase family enzyme/predicted kinase
MSAIAQERVLDALREPAAYPHPTGEVRAVRTHVSMVFLAGDLAYKVKRGVRFPFLDLSTLDRRRLCCGEEVRLNRRLSPELYLGVVAITEDPEGIHVGGAGEIVEYAVKMRRLPEDRMMDSLLRAGRLPPDAIARICERLVRFHAEAKATAAVRAFGSPSAIARLWEEHFVESSSWVGDFLDRFQEGLLRATARAWMVRKRPLLEQRHRDGRIRDGHGDLRCSSICFTEPIQIFDCLEFSRRLRCADVASDLAFLAMDLTWRGRRDLADELVRRYSELSGDAELGRLIPFYACYRACVRAKVSALSAGDAEASAAERARFRADAGALFALACQYAREDRPPVLVVVCGLSGTGKSTVAAQLGQAWSCHVLSTDRVRKEIHGARPTERRNAAFEEGIYSADATRRTYAALARRAEELLRSGRSVIADGAFAADWQRELLTDVAERSGALRFFLELTASGPQIEERLERRRRDLSAESDADWSIHLAQRARWDPITLPDWDHPVVTTDGEIRDVVRRAIQQLSLRLEPAQPRLDLTTKGASGSLG